MEYGVWRAVNSPVAVEYSPVILEELRLEAEQAFQSIPHGGLEIGAILLGDHDGNVVRIREWRPIACDHSRGPSFILSQSDAERLERQLRDLAGDDSLQGMAPVGWFLSRTRARLSMTQRDIELYDGFFPAPWQVTLVLQPSREGPVRAGFFFREPDGSVSEYSYEEFEVRRNPFALLQPPRPTAFKPTPPPVAEERKPAAELQPRPGPQPAEPARLPVSSPPARTRSRWLLAAAIMTVALIAGGWLLWQWPIQEQPVPLALHLETRDAGEVLIRWNPRSIAEASGGLLEIEENGETLQVSLDPAELRGGSVTFVRGAQDLDVTLTINGGPRGQVIEHVQLHGGPVAAPPPAEPQSDPEETKEALREEIQEVRRALEDEAIRNRQLQENLRIVRTRLRTRGSSVPPLEE